MADVELLPLPEPFVSDLMHGDLYTPEQVRACVEANLAPLQAENERLRAEVERLRRLVQERDAMLGKRLCAGVNADGKPRCLALAEAKARADRLEEALRNIAAMRWSSGEDLMDAAGAARAALAQEDRND